MLGVGFTPPALSTLLIALSIYPSILLSENPCIGLVAVILPTPGGTILYFQTNQVPGTAQVKMSKTLQPAPDTCKENTNLRPFLTQTVNEVKRTGKPKYLSLTIETGYVDPLAILEENYIHNEAVCYLERPSQEFSIACGEFLAHAEFDGDHRFRKAREWSKAILDQTLVSGDCTLPGTGPTLFLAANFESTATSLKSPPPLQIFLPHWQIIRKGGSHFLIVNLQVTPLSTTDELLRKVTNRISTTTKSKAHSERCNDLQKFALGEPSENFAYENAVKEALKEIEAGKLSKIVLARQLTFKTQGTLPPFSLAHLLRERFPDCFSFCLSTPNAGMMVGATPETLLRSSGQFLETEAVAGSAPRGPSAGKDAHWGKTLLARKKEVHEHRVVIDSILRRLHSIGLAECTKGKSRLLRLANLQHIRTPLRVKSNGKTHPLDAVAALHPTPAMGGSPREDALPLVRKLENEDRGWYSGVTGWFDHRGRGEFVVPIRCGKISPSEITLYAGAGVVAGSNPQQEKIETDWKLQAMLDVITGKSDFSGSV
jgi:menaquinone-specific isochorismate synthase